MCTGGRRCRGAADSQCNALSYRWLHDAFYGQPHCCLHQEKTRVAVQHSLHRWPRPPVHGQVRSPRRRIDRGHPSGFSPWRPRTDLGSNAQRGQRESRTYDTGRHRPGGRIHWRTSMGVSVGKPHAEIQRRTAVRRGSDRRSVISTLSVTGRFTKLRVPRPSIASHLVHVGRRRDELPSP